MYWRREEVGGTRRFGAPQKRFFFSFIEKENCFTETMCITLDGTKEHVEDVNNEAIDDTSKKTFDENVVSMCEYVIHVARSLQLVVLYIFQSIFTFLSHYMRRRESEIRVIVNGIQIQLEELQSIMVQFLHIENVNRICYSINRILSLLQSRANFEHGILVDYICQLIIKDKFTSWPTHIKKSKGWHKKSRLEDVKIRAMNCIHIILSNTEYLIDIEISTTLNPFSRYIILPWKKKSLIAMELKSCFVN